MPYYGPGMPWYDRGRGGAGNLTARIPANDDLEANRSPTSATFPRSPIPSSISTPQQQQQQQYTHTGRGGAGNYNTPTPTSPLQPRQGSSADQIEAAASASFAMVRRESGQSSTTRTPGRGGVGNYAAGALGGEVRRAEEELKRRQLEADVERGVSEQLALPPRAKVVEERVK